MMNTVPPRGGSVNGHLHGPLLRIFGADADEPPDILRDDNWGNYEKTEKTGNSGEVTDYTESRRQPNTKSVTSVTSVSPPSVSLKSVTSPGDAWGGVLDYSGRVALPADLESNPWLSPIARICRALSDLEADENGVFFVGARIMGESVGLRYQVAWKRMRALGGLGYLEMVVGGTPGVRTGGKANRYRWHEPPIPGGAPWNTRPIGGTES